MRLPSFRSNQRSKRHLLETLESRRLLASDLVAHWNADDLWESVNSETPDSGWTDRINGTNATINGTPLVSDSVFGAFPGIRLKPDDAFTVGSTQNPLARATDFAVSVTFRPASDSFGNNGTNWFENVGLVDMSRLGLTTDWGLALTGNGEAVTGMGRGFQKPIDNLRTENAALDDGLVHVLTVTRRDDQLKLYVDGELAATRSEMDNQARGAIPLTIGAMNLNGWGYAGDLREVRIYDGALSDNEVRHLVESVVMPITAADEFFVQPGESLAVEAARGVLANDVSRTQKLSAELMTGPTRGTLELRPDGSFLYNPAVNFVSGIDTFTYRATDGKNLSESVTVSLVINDPEDIFNLVINEIHFNPDNNGELVEFIEIHNPTSKPVSLEGAFLDNGIDFTFPENAAISSHGYVTITENAEHFLTKFGIPADGEWTGKLNNDGETIELYSPQGDRVDRVDYGLGFPWPVVGSEPGYSIELKHPTLDNDLGGSWRGSVGQQRLFNTGSKWSYFKGRTEPNGESGAWRQIDYDDADWLHGPTPIGYSRLVPPATELNDMRREYSTVYFRREFEIEDPADVETLVFDGIFDDGVNVWINGTLVGAANAPAEEAPFDAIATGRNNASRIVEFPVDNAQSILVPGTNVIAVQLLNEKITGSDAVFDGALRNTTRPGPGPSPDQPNSVLTEINGPQLRQIRQTPDAPTSNQEVTITIKATDPEGVDGLTLEYQIVGPGQYVRLSDDAYQQRWTSVPMSDEGTEADEAAGDAIYTAVIPAAVQQHRHLIRYRVRAVDAAGNEMLAPAPLDPQPNFAYFVYDGIPSWTGANNPGKSEAITFGADVMNQLPTYHLIADAQDVENCQYVNAFEEKRFTGTFVYKNRVYDHIQFGIRGEFSTYVTGKNKWKFFFHRGHEFLGDDNYGRPFQVGRRTLNFSAATTPWMPQNRGMGGLGEAIAYRIYELAGVPSPHTNFVQFRVIDDTAESTDNQYEGDLWGLYLAIEQPERSFVEERGLPSGSTFKIESGTGELKYQSSLQPTAKADIRTALSRTTRTGSNLAPVQYWRDNIDLDGYYSFRAVNREVNNMDLRDGWNHFVYYNSENQKFTQVPWDLDMLYVPTTHWSGVTRFEHALHHDELAIEYRNRGRELQDLLFTQETIGLLVDEYASFINPPAAESTFVHLDQFLWNHNPRSRGGHLGAFNRKFASFGSRGGGGDRTLVSADHEGFSQWIKDFLLPGPGAGSRPPAYGWEFLNREAADDQIPLTPTIAYVGADGFPLDQLQFEASPFDDPQGAHTFGAVEWRLAEIMDAEDIAFPPQEPVKYEMDAAWESGRVIDSNFQIAVPPQVLKNGHTYRARVRYVDDSGRASHWSEPLQFVANVGLPVELAAGLRISEVHYHPGPVTPAERAAGYRDENEFEFIELTNIGQQTLDLSTVSFGRKEIDGETQGIAFNFNDRQSLAPGAKVLVVENVEAFKFRYGDDLPIAGQWSGRLSNAGETLTLEAAGVVLQQFKYSDTWHPTTDGDGPSLDIIDLASAADYWNSATAWRASAEDGGSPGAASRTVGDSNGDGVFDEIDLALVFAAGEYEDQIPGNSRWETGDWDGDGDFTSEDIVFAFQSGQYRPSINALHAAAVDDIFDNEI